MASDSANGAASVADQEDCEMTTGELFEIEEDEACGRFLIAARDLDEGELILSETPTGKLQILLEYLDLIIEFPCSSWSKQRIPDCLLRML